MSGMSGRGPVDGHELAERLTVGLARAAAQAEVAPGARSRLDRWLVARRRRTAARRLGAALAVGALAAGALLTTARGEESSRVVVGDSAPPATAAPSGTARPAGDDPDAGDAPTALRVLPAVLPDGYRVARTGVESTERNSDPLDSMGPPVAAVQRQWFRPPTAPGAYPTFSLGFGPIPTTGSFDGMDRVVAGPYTLHLQVGNHAVGYLVEGDRLVTIMATGASDEQMTRFAGALRWDPASGRYLVEGDADGVIEAATMPGGGPAPVTRYGQVVLQGLGRPEIRISTRADSGPLRVERIAALNVLRSEPVDVNGRPAVIARSIAPGGGLIVVVIPWADGSVTDVSGTGVPDDALLAVARSLHRVDRDAWNAAPAG